jgi:catechol 2,3-dioxygenase
MQKDKATPTEAVTPTAVNHVVLTVRDIEESHRFWTEIIGLKLVGALKPQAPDGPPRPKMRFYSADHDGKMSHHDVALLENKNYPVPDANWDLMANPSAVNHIALALPTREAWLKQLEFMQNRGVKFHRRVDHGMTHSVYISDPNGHGIELLYELPREMWENDIEGAQNYAVRLPTEGPEALVDRTDVPSFGRTGQPAAE